MSGVTVDTVAVAKGTLMYELQKLVAIGPRNWNSSKTRSSIQITLFSTTGLAKAGVKKRAETKKAETAVSWRRIVANLEVG